MADLLPRRHPIPWTMTVSRSPAKLPITRRRFLLASACAGAGLALYAGEVERHWIEITHRDVFLSGLPQAFDGFRVAQLSDIHLDEYTEPFFLRDAVDPHQPHEPRCGVSHRRLCHLRDFAEEILHRLGVAVRQSSQPAPVPPPLCRSRQSRRVGESARRHRGAHREWHHRARQRTRAHRTRRRTILACRARRSCRGRTRSRCRHPCVHPQCAA